MGVWKCLWNKDVAAEGGWKPGPEEENREAVPSPPGC